MGLGLEEVGDLLKDGWGVERSARGLSMDMDHSEDEHDT